MSQPVTWTMKSKIRYTRSKSFREMLGYNQERYIADVFSVQIVNGIVFQMTTQCQYLQLLFLFPAMINPTWVFPMQTLRQAQILVFRREVGLTARPLRWNKWVASEPTYQPVALCPCTSITHIISTAIRIHSMAVLVVHPTLVSWVDQWREVRWLDTGTWTVTRRTIL